MAFNQSRRLRAEDLEADREAIIAVQSISNYKPINPAYSTQALADLSAARDRAQHDEIRTQQLLATARDTARATEWAMHNSVIGARTQIRAQFGDDSNEVQAMGLKKRSDRKRPASRATRTAQSISE